MNKKYRICALVLSLLLFTGCMGKVEQKEENKAPAELVTEEQNQEEERLVSFLEPALQEAVQEQLNKKTIYESDMEKITSITIHGNKKSVDISELNMFQNLKTLSILDAKIENISVLWELKKIEKLILRNDKISDLKGIENCQSIQFLDLRGNLIQSSEELKQLSNLHTIYVSDSFDRTCLDFLVGRFRNADVKTKQYLLSKQYHLE